MPVLLFGFLSLTLVPSIVEFDQLVLLSHDFHRGIYVVLEKLIYCEYSKFCSPFGKVISQIFTVSKEPVVFHIWRTKR